MLYIFALQSNNMFHLEEHINCVHNVKELESKSELSNILYSGTLEMPNGYERYMVIAFTRLFNRPLYNTISMVTYLKTVHLRKIMILVKA